MWWVVNCSVPSHYSKRWNLIQRIQFFFQDNTCEIVVFTMVGAISFSHHCVKHGIPVTSAFMPKQKIFTVILMVTITKTWSCYWQLRVFLSSIYQWSCQGKTLPIQALYISFQRGQVYKCILGKGFLTARSSCAKLIYLSEGNIFISTVIYACMWWHI